MKLLVPVVVVVAALAAGCGGSKSAAPNTVTVTTAVTSTTPTTTAQTGTTTTGGTSGSGKVVTHGRFHYPPVLIRNYMKSCVGSAGGGAKKRAYCACTLDKLSDNVSTRDFAEIGLSHGRIPARIKRFMSGAVADCADKL